MVALARTKGFLAWILGTLGIGISNRPITQDTYPAAHPALQGTFSSFQSYSGGSSNTGIFATSANPNCDGEEVNAAFARLADLVFKSLQKHSSDEFVEEFAITKKSKKDAKVARKVIKEAANIMLAIFLTSGLMVTDVDSVAKFANSFDEAHHETIATSLSKFFDPNVLNRVADKYYSALKNSKGPIEAMNFAMEVNRDNRKEPLGCSFDNDEFYYRRDNDDKFIERRYADQAPPPLKLDTKAEVTEFMHALANVSLKVMESKRLNDVDQMIRLVK